MKRTKLLYVLLTALIVITLLLSGCGTTTQMQSKTELNFEGVTFSDFRVFEAPAKSLRGMAASEDGKYLYTGHIQLGTSGVHKIDAVTGEILWAYRDASKAPVEDPIKEYPKSVAVDDRGYVYAMISYNGKTGSTLAILNDADGTPVSENFVDFGQVDSGANGIVVKKDGDKYFAYFISNYGPNRIYCYDVTDSAKPVINTDFGIDGIVNLAKKTEVAEADANYIALDENGDIYVTIKLADGAKADAVGKFSSDGKTFEKVLDCPEAYGIYIANGYMLVSTYNGESSVINVYKMSDYSLVATLAADVADHGHYSQIVMAGNKIYLADQAYQTGDSADELGSRILVSSEITEK